MSEPVRHLEYRQRFDRVSGWWLAILASACAVGVAALAERWLGLRDLSLVFMLAVVLVAARTRIGPALATADMLAVACIEEAVALRKAGARQPILLLEGPFAAEELDWCARLGFEIAVHEPGLSASESLMVTTLKKAKGRVVTYEALAALGARGDLAEGGPDPKVASVRLSNIKRKRPDLRDKLLAVHGLGIRYAA